MKRRNGPANKTTQSDVRKIVSLYYKGQFQWKIAKQFGLSQRAVSLILRDTSNWRHIHPFWRYNC